VPGDDPLSERALSGIRTKLEQAVASAKLSGIETLLLEEVALSSRTTNGHLGRDEAAEWLREHAGPGLRLSHFERHHHVALLVAVIEGWPSLPPLEGGRLGLNLRLYDPTGHQDDQRGSWMIDALIAE
jgi:hypothetical protein